VIQKGGDKMERRYYKVDTESGQERIGLGYSLDEDFSSALEFECT